MCSVSLSLCCCLLRAGKLWLAEVAEQPNVVKLPSGLLYEVIESGSGAYPTRESKVTVNYRGNLQDGTQFDSSFDRGQPASFGVTQVIKGWTEALMRMREGDKWVSERDERQTDRRDERLRAPHRLHVLCISCVCCQEVWIPSHLAYGSRGAGGQIKADAALKFRIELITVQGNKRQTPEEL